MPSFRRRLITAGVNVSPHRFSRRFDSMAVLPFTVLQSRFQYLAPRAPESWEELRGAFKRLELAAVHVWLDLRVDLGKESLLRFDCSCCNRLVEPVVDLSFVDVNRRIRKN